MNFSWEVIAINIVTTALVTFASLHIALRTRLFDHRRSRRRYTIELMQFYWNARHVLDVVDHWAVRTLLLSLNQNQCSRIFMAQDVLLEANYVNQIERIFNKFHVDLRKNDRGEFYLEQVHTIYLRDKILAMLNNLEVIACAYVADLCDEDIFIREFRPIFYASGARPWYLTFIDVTHVYPSLRELHHRFDRVNKRSENRGGLPK